jgi:hypothetical protein
MKRLLRFYPLLMFAALTSCMPHADGIRYTNLVIPIEERMIPQTAPVNVPLSIYAHTSAPDGCWSNIRFIFEDTDERAYQLFALADYESKGACPAVLVTADTVLTFTPSRPGNYVITIWNSASTYDKDTIVVGEALP